LRAWICHKTKTTDKYEDIDIKYWFNNSRLQAGENLCEITWVSFNFDHFEMAKQERTYGELDGNQNYWYALNHIIDENAEDDDGARYFQTPHLSHEFGFLREPFVEVRVNYDIRFRSPYSLLNWCREQPLQVAKEFIRGGANWLSVTDIIVACFCNDVFLRPDQRAAVIREMVNCYGLPYHRVVYEVSR